MTKYYITDKFILDALQNTEGFEYCIIKKKTDDNVEVPRCPCGKTPLRCPNPKNCLMENL